MAISSGAEAHRAPIEYAGDTPSASGASNDLAGGGARSYGYGAISQQGDVLDLRRPEPAEATTTPASQSAAQSPASGQGRPAWLENERVGPPYQANGRWYVPAAEPGYEATGMASWYGPAFHGGRTASGEIYDQEAITAAHPTLPIPSLVQVTNLENGREVIVRVNDRGPFVSDRILDLSHGAAFVLGIERTGTARVHIRYLGPAPRHYGDPAAPMPALAPPPSSVQPLQSANAEEGPTSEGPASLLPPPARDESPAPAPGAPSVQQVTYAPPAPMPVTSSPVSPAVSPGAPSVAPSITSSIASGAGSYFVQVGAFSDVDNAHRVQSAVMGAGQAAVDVRRNRAGAELFRVRVGPFASREAAETARRSIAALGYAESVVVAP